MKVSFYFAFRELRRRPRRVVSMLLVAAAILTALNMLLFYLEADWRAQVMPDNPNNYHFTVKDHTDAQRRYIVSQPWVQAWYEEDVNDRYGTYQYSQLKIRVDWENVLSSNALAWEIFDHFDLWHSDFYEQSFESVKSSIERTMRASWGFDTHRNGKTFEQWLEQNTEQSFLRNYVQNTRFTRLTINSYIIRPEFAMYMGMFSLFLGSTMAILFWEQYRQNLAEFGTMRAYGMKKRQIVFINCIETFVINLAAIPVSWLITAAVVWIYSLATNHLDDGSVYLTLGEYLPLGAMAIVALMMLAVALLGCIGICLLYRNYTVMELLRGIEAHRISFVSKTSPRFESANGLAIYDRLYITRTRASFLLGALILAMMLPLPLLFFTIVVNFVGGEPTGGDVLIVIYHIVQTILLFITAITVTFVSTRQAADTRTHEFAVLRALGANRRRVKITAFTQAVLQSIITTVLAAIFFINMSDTTQTVSSLPIARNINFFALILQILLYAIGAAILILPPTLGGVAASLRRFFKRSTIANLRETEV